MIRPIPTNLWHGMAILAEHDMCEICLRLRDEASFEDKISFEQYINRMYGRFIRSAYPDITAPYYTWDGRIVEKSIHVLSSDDELLNTAIDYVVSEQQVSIPLLQRRFRIQYLRAVRLLDMMESRGIIGPENRSESRKALIKVR